MIFSMSVELVQEVDDEIVLKSRRAHHNMLLVLGSVSRIRRAQILPLEPQRGQMLQLFLISTFIAWTWQGSFRAKATKKYLCGDNDQSYNYHDTHEELRGPRVRRDVTVADRAESDNDVIERVE